jgi:hypothetical protein
MGVGESPPLSRIRPFKFNVLHAAAAVIILVLVLCVIAGVMSFFLEPAVTDDEPPEVRSTDPRAPRGLRSATWSFLDARFR